MESLHKKYKSKIDIWIILLLLTPILTLLKTTAPYITSNIYINIFMFFYVSFLYLIYKKTTYEITNTHLKIYEIFSYTEISIPTITKISKVTSIYASSSFSISKLKIHYSGQYILISPENKLLFTNELRKINPAIKS